MSEFEKELERLINKYSIENHSNTPDFILAQYLCGCLAIWNQATMRREQWFGRGTQFLAGAPSDDPSVARIAAAKAEAGR